MPCIRTGLLLSNFVRPHVRVMRLCRGGMQRPIIAIDVKEFRAGALLGFANCRLCGRQLLAYLGSGIIQIPGQDRMFGANDNTGRFQSYLHTMGTEMTFGGGVGLRVKIDRVVGAGLHA